jgi:hypothetical protein
MRKILNLAAVALLATVVAAPAFAGELAQAAAPAVETATGAAVDAVKSAAEAPAAVAEAPKDAMVAKPAKKHHGKKHHRAKKMEEKTSVTK